MLNVINNHSIVLCSEERSFNQTLREEQDRAYEESLRADQEKVHIEISSSLVNWINYPAPDHGNSSVLAE